MEPIVLKNSKKRLALFALLGAVFVAVGIWMVLTDHSQKAQMVGWANLIFFGLCEAVFIRQLFDDRPRIIISDEGVFDRTLRVGTIEWRDIVGAEVVRIQSTAFIGLELADEEKYLSRLPGWSGKLGAANDALGFKRLNINLSGIDAKPEELAEMIVSRAYMHRQFGG